MNRQARRSSAARGGDSSRNAIARAALPLRVGESAIDPFGPGGEFDETVRAGSLLSQAAYDALAVAADEAAACVFAAYNPDEEENSGGLEPVEAVLPPVFARRYDPAFLAEFWVLSEAMAERIRAARGGPVRLATPGEEIAFYAACAMSARMAEGGRLEVGGGVDGVADAAIREIDDYYAACSLDAGVEALYRLPCSDVPERDVARAGLARFDFENW